MNIIDKILLGIAPGIVSKRIVARERAIFLDKTVNARRGYEGATGGRRGKGFDVLSTSPNRDIDKSAKTLRTRSRQLFNNTPHNKRAVKVIANNVVGTGIVPTFYSDNKKAADKLQKAWNKWADTIDCDFDGNFDFTGIEKLVMKTIQISGECLVIKKDVDKKINPYGLQIQVLEPEYLDALKNVEYTDNGGFIRNGIEYDKNGKRIRYWIYERHPDDYGSATTYPHSNPIDMADICHLYDADRPGQHGGVPASTSTMLTEKDFSDYQDAEVFGKKIAAAHVGAVVTPDPDKLDGDINKDDYDDTDSLRMEPGMFFKLKPGEDIRFNAPPLSNNYEAFARVNMRAIASGWGISYEQLTNDYSQVNFSSGRMGWLEVSRNFDDWQQLLIKRFCAKVKDWFVDKYKIVNSIKSLPEDMYASWTTPRREMLDPVKETAALIAQMGAGMVSWEEVVKSNGYNPDEVFKELQKNYDQFKQMGIFTSWMMPPPPVKNATDNTDNNA